MSVKPDHSSVFTQLDATGSRCANNKDAKEQKQERAQHNIRFMSFRESERNQMSVDLKTSHLPLQIDQENNFLFISRA